MSFSPSSLMSLSLVQMICVVEMKGKMIVFSSRISSAIVSGSGVLWMIVCVIFHYYNAEFSSVSVRLSLLMDLICNSFAVTSARRRCRRGL